ncbi:MAG: hypothetical protein HY657_11585 [Acidobacteria bacterium]|nr:hypothetical protein [Acidobacteriota bacterium]
MGAGVIVVSWVVGGGVVEFRYRPQDMQRVEVPLDHARWFVGLLSQLRPAQVRQAFEASGAAGAEVDGFSAAVLDRIAQLRDAVSEAD